MLPTPAAARVGAVRGLPRSQGQHPRLRAHATLAAHLLLPLPGQSVTYLDDACFMLHE